MNGELSLPTMKTVADPKLLHLVGKVLSVAGGNDRRIDNMSNQDFDNLVQQLRTQHREYQRKNLSQFKLAVQFAVNQLQQRRHNQSKKRKPELERISPNDDAIEDDERQILYQKYDEEDEYDQAAVIRDAMPSGNRLNESILQFHRNVSSVNKRLDENSLAGFPNSDNVNANIQGGSARQSAHINIEDARQKSESAVLVAPSATVTTSITEDVGQRHPQSSVSVGRQSRKRRVVRSSSSMLGDGNDTVAGESNKMTQLAFTIPVTRPTERYTDLGGMDDIITAIRQLIEYPIARPELYRHLGVDPPRGVLLRGPPGT
jgi:ATP-dependent 26S proteasome regulatory subunit